MRMISGALLAIAGAIILSPALARNQTDPIIMGIVVGGFGLGLVIWGIKDKEYDKTKM
jgi:hypothetical protein